MSSWSLRTSSNFDKSFRKLDRSVAILIKKTLEEITELPHPRLRGKALGGNPAGFWRYRIGDYRVIAEIFDNELIIIALVVEHRSRIYRG